MDKIITAVASYGMSGEVFHCPILDDHSGFLIKTVVERNNRKSIEKYPYIKIARSFDEIITDQEIELVVINTPNSLHYSMAKSALEAGKHVVVEKPFTITVKEGEELIKVANENGKVLSVFHSKRYETDFRTIKKIIDENLVGEPVELFWNYDRFRSNVTHKKWKEDNIPGAGTLYDLGVHLIDSVTQLFGLPEEITCELKSLRSENSSPDYFHITLNFQNLTVFLHSSTFVLQKGPHITFHGRRGSFFKYSNDPQEEQSKRGVKPSNPFFGVEENEKWGTLYSLNGDIKEERKVESVKGNYSDFYDGIFNAVRLNKPAPVDPEQALHNIRIVEHALRSFQERRTIKYEF